MLIIHVNMLNVTKFHVNTCSFRPSEAAYTAGADVFMVKLALFPIKPASSSLLPYDASGIERVKHSGEFTTAAQLTWIDSQAAFS
jgi:hypothetical protein